MPIINRRQWLGGAAASCLLPMVAARGEVLDAMAVSSEAMAEVEALAGAFLSRFSAPGLSVAYARDGVPVFTAAFGLADRDSGEKLTTAHRFRAASIAKPITAAAIMALIDGGKLTADRLVFGEGGILADYVALTPEHPQRDWLEAITVDHLLTHSSGGWGNDQNDPMFRHGAMDHRALIKETLLHAPLTQAPGTNYAYSNFGYCLLGRVIEQVSGQAYDEAVRQAILEPSGSCAMSIGGNGLADRRSDEVAYFAQDGGDAYGMNVTRMDSHGGWLATPTELVDFAMRVDGYDSVPDLISAEGVALMAKPSAAYDGYGRGWTLNPRHGNWWHTGSLPGTTTILVRVDGGVCFAGMVNTRTIGSDNTSGALDTLMWDIYRQVIG